MVLTDKQKVYFEENGYLVIRNLLTAAEVEGLKRRADQIAAGVAEHVPEHCVQVEPAISKGQVQAESRIESIRKLWNLVGYDDVMYAHATNPKILDVLQDLIGPDLKLYGDQLFMKPPHHGSRKEYHQDSQSWKHIVPHDLVSCWAAMDDATLDNGCLWVIPGSHKWGLIGKEQEREIEQQTLAGEMKDEVAVELQAGDCSFHHSLLLHSSYANRSPKRRRGYATHYMSAKLQYIGDGEKPDYLSIRGQEFPGYV